MLRAAPDSDKPRSITVYVINFAREPPGMLLNPSLRMLPVSRELNPFLPPKKIVQSLCCIYRAGYRKHQFNLDRRRRFLGGSLVLGQRQKRRGDRVRLQLQQSLRQRLRRGGAGPF